jgi:hypothetical protein
MFVLSLKKSSGQIPTLLDFTPIKWLGLAYCQVFSGKNTLEIIRPMASENFAISPEKFSPKKLDGHRFSSRVRKYMMGVSGMSKAFNCRRNHRPT